MGHAWKIGFAVFPTADEPAADCRVRFIAKQMPAPTKVSRRSSLPHVRKCSAACNNTGSRQRQDVLTLTQLTATAESSEVKFDRGEDSRAGHAKEPRCANSKAYGSSSFARQGRSRRSGRRYVASSSLTSGSTSYTFSKGFISRDKWHPSNQFAT